MDYYSFVQQAHAPYFLQTDFGKLICDTIYMGLQEKNFRLIISMPPRHGKSLMVTETLPAYFLLKNPHKKVIVSSYNQQLATRFGNRNKEKFTAWGPSTNLFIASDTKAKQFWEIADHRGAMLSSGLFGGLTGMGADLLIIDDPIKNRQEALSFSRRESIFNEYQHTLRPRLQADGAVILIMTRWHEDDLAGRLCKQSSWKMLSLPAFADKKDILGRKEGAALWPEKYDVQALNLTKKEIGTRSFEALYQQRPTQEDGDVFLKTWWKFYNKLPEKPFDQFLHSWDCAFTGSENADYVVGQVWGKIGGESYLIDQVRKKLDFVDTVKEIRKLLKKYPSPLVLIEAKANGEAIISTLRQEVPGIIPIYPTESKVSRALSVTPFIEAGNIYLPQHANFLETLLLELNEFPNGKYDDSVDALSQALQRLYQGSRFSF